MPTAKKKKNARSWHIRASSQPKRRKITVQRFTNHEHIGRRTAAGFSFFIG